MTRSQHQSQIEPNSSELDVLIVAPTGRDATLLSEQLERRGIGVRICASVAEICELDLADVGALLIAEEAMGRGALDSLTKFLLDQPPWSDLPVILMTERGEESARRRQIGGVLTATGNVTFIQRPVRLITLHSVVVSALKSRAHQCEVRRLLEETRRAVEQRDMFLAVLGHELRNPLAAIHGAISLATEQGIATDDFHEHHDVIRRQTAHMSRLVDDLLDVARITVGKIRLDRRPVDLRDVVRSSIQLVRPAAIARDQDLVYTAPPEPAVVSGDTVRLEQVVNNLLTNAVRYTADRGRIEVSLRHAASADGQGDAVELHVRDTGVGLTADAIETIFDPFVQVDATLDRSRGGLGMGLQVVRSLVNLHDGSVRAESDGPERGTTFIVSLPRITDDAIVAAARKGDGPRHVRRNILLVEDNHDVRRVMSRLLRARKHRVITAADGEAAVREAVKHRPDVILLDIGLPIIDGYEAARRIRAELGNGPTLIALTGYGQPTDRDAAHDAGFDHHLVKPVKLDQLIALIAASKPVSNDVSNDVPNDAASRSHHAEPAAGLES